MSPCLPFLIQVLSCLTSLSKFTLITPGVSTLSLQHLTKATDTLTLQIYRISNKELGHHIIEQMNSVKGQSFKKWTKYIWDGSTWINNKTKK